MPQHVTRALGRTVRRARSRARAELLRRGDRRAGVALVYHRVADPPGDRDRELVPNHGTRLFRAQLRHLLDGYRLVPVSELPAAAAARSPGDPFPVAITFDDDLPTHLGEAAPILRELGAPAAFFLAGDAGAEPRVRWWVQLQAAVDRGVVDRELIELALGRSSAVEPDRAALKPLARAIEAMDASARATIERALAERLDPPPDQPRMTAGEIGELARAGFEIGFHTVGHELLTNLAAADLERALDEGRQELAQAAGRPVEMLSYPHGKADARVAASARAAGFQLAFTGAAEPVRADSDPLLLGRLEPSFDSVEALAAQLNGIVGLAAPPAR